MDKLVILGHHNFGLSLLFENLASNTKDVLEIDIVSNIPEGKNALKDFPYVSENIQVREYHYTDWKRPPESKFLNSGMSPNSRKKIFDFFLSSFGISMADYASCFHPTATIATSARIGKGAHIGPKSCIAPFAEIGHQFFLNRSSSVGHHVRIEDYVNVSSGCHIGSQCLLKKGVVIGIGTTVFDRVTIGENSIVGGGSLVTKDIPAGVIAYGSPVKVIRSIDD